MAFNICKTAPDSRTLSLMNSRLKNHLALGVLSFAGLGAAAIVGAPETAADRLSIVSAYLCLLLLGLALLIGPASVLRSGRLVVNSYIRRDTGIWAATTGLVHFYLANVLSMNYEYLGTYVDNAVQPPAAAVRSTLYSSATISGYVIALLFIMLLLLSSDGMMRKLGLKWWKRLQRLSYLAFVLTCIHAFEFQVLETRPIFWVVVVLAVAIATVCIQFIGFLAVRKRQANNSCLSD